MIFAVTIDPQAIFLMIISVTRPSLVSFYLLNLHDRRLRRRDMIRAI